VETDATSDKPNVHSLSGVCPQQTWEPFEGYMKNTPIFKIDDEYFIRDMRCNGANGFTN